MNDYKIMPLSIISSLNHQQIDQLVTLYSNEFWCDTRTYSDVSLMLENTDIVIGVKNGADELVGFVRVLTDYVFKATIYDLIVHPDWRGTGIGTMLMDSVIKHQALKNVDHFDLNCLPEMYLFYQRWGFTTELGGLGFMRRFHHKD